MTRGAAYVPIWKVDLLNALVPDGISKWAVSGYPAPDKPSVKCFCGLGSAGQCPHCGADACVYHLQEHILSHGSAMSWVYTDADAKAEWQTVLSELPSKHWSVIWKINPDFRIDRGAADFYVLQHLRALCDLGMLTGEAAEKASQYVDEELPLIVDEMAEQLANYLEMAIGGELRHLKIQKVEGMVKASGLTGMDMHEEVLDVFRKGVLSHEMTRHAAWISWGAFRQLKGLQAAKICRWSYFNHKWVKGYGGSKWGKCADVLVRYREGELSKEIFLDTAFGLEHNCNNVFDKVWSEHIADLRAVLTANLADNMGYLLTKASLAIRDGYVNLTSGQPEKSVAPSLMPKPKIPSFKVGFGSLAFVLSPQNVCLMCSESVPKPCNKTHAVFKPATKTWHCYQCHKGKPTQVVTLSKDGFTKLFALCSFCLLDVPKPNMKVAGIVLPT